MCVQSSRVSVVDARQTRSLSAHSALKWFLTSVCSHVFEYFDHYNDTVSGCIPVFHRCGADNKFDLTVCVAV